MHVVLVAALCLYGKYGAGGEPGGGGGEAWQLPLQAGRALALLLVVVQPAAYGVSSSRAVG